MVTWNRTLEKEVELEVTLFEESSYVVIKEISLIVGLFIIFRCLEIYHENPSFRKVWKIDFSV